MGLFLITRRNHSIYPIPTPTLPLKGREKSSAFLLKLSPMPLADPPGHKGGEANCKAWPDNTGENSCSTILGLLFKPCRKPEGRAFSFLTLHPDFTTHQGDKLTAYG